MSLAAFFAPDHIPEDLFRQPSRCYPPVLAELFGDPGGLDDAIGALAHLSLIDFDAERRAFSAHRLVQAAARDALGAEAPDLDESALAGWSGVSRAGFKLGRSASAWSRMCAQWRRM